MDVHQFLIGVVDDDPRVLESFEELLASGGHKALLFPSAEAFIDANGFQEVDCLISDIGMPGMNGLELLRIAHAKHPDLPVILITARDEQYHPASLASQGARCLFRKPFDAKELLATVGRILQPDSGTVEPR